MRRVSVLSVGSRFLAIPGLCAVQERKKRLSDGLGMRFTAEALGKSPNSTSCSIWNPREGPVLNMSFSRGVCGGYFDAFLSPLNCRQKGTVAGSLSRPLSAQHTTVDHDGNLDFWAGHGHAQHMR